MGKIPFTDEQLNLLKSNPNTYNVTAQKLYLSKSFKEFFYKEYQAGKLPRQILEDSGYPASILGNSRIWGIAASIKKEAVRPEGFSEGSAANNYGKSKADTPEAAIKHLQNEIDYLRQEVDFLKKISSIRSIKK